MGLGASKENFLEAFRREEFRSFTMLATDLVGFGDSEKPADFAYQMREDTKAERNPYPLYL
jgi:pimeloyl-ACP methyl ester carboxylesterase